MLELIVVGLVGGLITGLSPCILPMLPVIFFAGAAGPATPRVQADDARAAAPVLQRVGAPAVDGPVGPPAPPAPPPPAPPRSDASERAASERTGSRRGVARRVVLGRRPIQIILGLIVSFTVFTLAGSVILSALGLPQTFLRWAGITVLAAVGLGMLVPRLEEWLQRPFYRLPKVQGKLHGNPFVFGLGLGTLYVPCAGPILAAITVAGATGRVGVRTVVLTVAFATGASIPLLAFAAAGARIRDRLTAYRRRARLLHVVGGVSLIAVAVALSLGATDALQRAVPNYTQGLQHRVEDSTTVRSALQQVDAPQTDADLSRCVPGAAVLQSCGTAPAVAGISAWLNTPGGAPLTLPSLRGHVVLIDFWAYSCINCQRAIPHVQAWDRAYRSAGLTVIGVHSPEFAFEKDTGNLRHAVASMGITYPVAQDDKLTTWTNFDNQYWPAEYLIDATGTVRHIQYGEGDYDGTERLIRQLLSAAHPAVPLPAAASTVGMPAAAGLNNTPETYFGSDRSDSFEGAIDLAAQATAVYRLPATQPADTYSLGGTWTDHGQYVEGARRSQLRLSYRARDVYLVLGGTGTLQISINGRPRRTLVVAGTPMLYPILQNPAQASGLLTVTSGGGVQFYTATFG